MRIQHRRRLVVGVGVVLLFVACADENPHGDEIARRLANIEQQLTAQQHQLSESQHQLSESQHQLSELKASQVAAASLQQVLEQIDAFGERLTKVEAQKAAAAPPPRARFEPDRSATYAVPIDHDPVLGSAKAKVTLVMAMDFACPYCRKAWGTIDQLRAKYGTDLRVVYKAYVIHTTTATHAAQAACAATHQGKFRELADLLWTKSFDARDFSDATIDGLAAEAQLDVSRYHADLVASCPQEVKNEMAQLTKLGVGATPSFFINGRYMSGAMPIENFSTLVDEELAKATDAVKRGVKPERYYDQEIVGKGLKELAPTP